MSGKSAISWTDMTWNPTTGCTRVTEGCDHCLDPNTLVLYADFTWRRIGDVQIGDVLIGFDEYVQSEKERGMRMLRPSVVTATWRTRQPAMKVTTDKAEVICSGNHRFISYDSRRWVHAENIRLGARIRSIGCRHGTRENDEYAAGYLMGMTDGDGTWRFAPGQRSDKKGFPQCYWRVALADEEALILTQSCLSRFGLRAEIRFFVANNGRGYRRPMQKLEIRSIPQLTVLDELLEYQTSYDYGRGYIAGLFDAEGSFSMANIRIANGHIPYLDRVVDYGRLLDFDFRIETAIPNKVSSARLYGPRRDRIAFFTLNRPAILRKAQPLFNSAIDAEPATVNRLELLGERELVDIETTTHTFFANGLATHNCYAFTLHDRRHEMYQRTGGLYPGGKPMPKQYALPFSTVQLLPERLEDPLHLKKPRKIFVDSMSDLFHSQVPEEYIRRVFEVMCQASWHSFQVLTKRPARVARLAPALPWPGNIWIGTSVELDQLTPRIDLLRQVPTANRFLSLEPLLGPLPSLDLDGICWVITGGESGPDARPCDPAWVRAIRDRCIQQGVAYFHKQWGGQTAKSGGDKLDGQHWHEFPVDMVGTREVSR